MTPNFKSRSPLRKKFWSAPAKRSGDGALDYSAAELQTIQSGVALRLPPQSKNLRFSSLDLHTKVFDDGIRQHFARHPFGLGARLGFAERTIDGNLEILSLANIADAAITEQLDRMLDRFALRIQDARLQRDVNLGFHCCVVRSLSLWEGVRVRASCAERRQPLSPQPSPRGKREPQTFRTLALTPSRTNGRYYAKTLRNA